MPINLCLIDSGYKTEAVYDFCRRSKLAAVLLQVKAADILSIDQQLAFLEFIEARDQLGDGRFSRARMPH